jgi:hypothetical protein
MSELSPFSAEFDALLAGAMDDRLTESDRLRLEESIRENPALMDRYVEHAVLHAMLRWEHAPPLNVKRQGSGVERSASEEEIEGKEEARSRSDERPVGVAPSSAFTLPLSFSFGGGAILSYAITAGLLVAVIVAAQFWSLTDDPQQLVSSIIASPISVVASPPATAADTGTKIIGKVTETSKCRWADSSSPTRKGESVSLGRTYALTEGLLEITYHTGAKVILEGPAVFSADRFNGGALRLGRATVWAGKLDRAKLDREERARNHPAPPPRANAFCVRTPSATVAGNGDQDAKFGVEVCRSLTTYTRVFQGPIAFAAPGLPAYALPTDYCVWTGAGPRHDGLMIFHTGPEPPTFALEVPKSPPVCSSQPAAAKENLPRKKGTS